MSQNSIGRLSLYRRLLADALAGGMKALHSHDLARLAGVTAAQVRRDLMSVGYNGSPAHGYDVERLISSIESLLHPPTTQGLALVGVGNLGKAMLAYFRGRHPNLAFVAGFDADPAKAERVMHGCRCYPMSEIEGVIRREGILTAVIAVPAESCQEVAEQLVAAGVTSILNFAPTTIRVGPEVHVEHNDLTTSIERVAFFGRALANSKESVQ